MLLPPWWDASAASRRLRLVGGLGVKLDAARIFALLAGAVVLEAVVVGERTGNAHRRLVAQRRH